MVNVKPSSGKAASECEWGIGQILEQINWESMELKGTGVAASLFGLGMHLQFTTVHATYNLLSPWLCHHFLKSFLCYRFPQGREIFIDTFVIHISRQKTKMIS